MATRAQSNRAPAVYPELDLPLIPPLPPMESERVESVPAGDQWLYEPKWDGFRAIIFRDGDTVAIQSKAGQPLGRYFPEIVEAALSITSQKYVIDGEIVIPLGGRISFDDLLLRLHPAASRVKKLAAESPAQFYAFDLLAESTKSEVTSLLDSPLRERRKKLESFFDSIDARSAFRLSPATVDHGIATDWFENFGDMGLDGVMAKLLDERYHSGDRKAMVKVKHMLTADCVVAGFRYLAKAKEIGALLLGLYDDQGILHHVGNASAFTAAERKEVGSIVEPLAGGEGFSGRSPGGPSRWSKNGAGEFTPVAPTLVGEFRYDYFNQGRFRHGTKLLRWRPDKAPKQCTFAQVDQSERAGSLSRLGM